MSERALLPVRFPSDEDGLRRLAESVNDLLLESRLVTRLEGTSRGIYTSDASSVTGNGTVYPLVFDTVTLGDTWFDGTTYTAPYNGLYAVQLVVWADGLAQQHNYSVTNMIANGQTIPRTILIDTSNSGPALSFPHAETLRLDAGQTITFDFAVFGGPLSVNVRGDTTNVETYVIILPVERLP